MSRRDPELQALAVTTWPTVAWTELDAAARKHCRARMQAIERYAGGEPIKDIEDATGVNRRQLYRMLERALEPHHDGRIFGFRALIAHVRVTEYVRVRPVTVQGDRGGSGAVCALSQLLERYPTLAGWLRLQLKQRRIKLDQRDNDDGLHTRLRGLKALHAEFRQQCRQVGLTAADYPFNTAGQAIRSLSACVKTELLRSFGAAARAAGASHLKGLPRPDGEAGAAAASRPYQVVEFDGHKLDIRLKVVVRDPLGFAHEFEIERVWLLAIIDVCTRAVLGYTGSHPRDLRRALADPKGNLRLYVSLHELEELIEYAIASYHGTPHAGLNSVTPLEAMTYFVRGKQQLLTWLPERHRRTLCLMQTARRCRVRAYLEQGVDLPLHDRTRGHA